MIIASWNVNSISVRLPHVLDWLEKNEPNVLCIQETKSPDEKFPKEELEKAGYHCQFFGEKAYNGVAVLSREQPTSIQKGFPDESVSDSKRLMDVQFGSLSIINVYIPNGQDVGADKYLYKLSWMKQLLEYLSSHHNPDEHVILCGDFNVAPEDRDVYDPVGLAGHILLSQAERAHLDEIKNWGFVDTFRQHHEDPGHYSWWDYRAMSFRRKQGLRIDHMWASQPLSKICTRSWIDAAPRKLDRPSDHAPIAAEFKLP